jgi:hypothetical protein
MAKTWTAPVTAVGSAVTVTDSDMANFPHIYVSFTYYDSVPVATRSEVTPGAGTIAVTGKVKGSQGTVAFPDSPVDCTAVGDTANGGAPITAVTATPAGVTTATHYVMTITGNRS